MLLFQWNALRVGDLVDVHDDKAVEFDIHRGVVSIVQTRGQQANDVAVRLVDERGTVLRPRRDAVHLVPCQDATTCWRCSAEARSHDGTDLDADDDIDRLVAS
jgi:hypothetical protein